ncbi:MAG: ribosome-associated translation inhibitor RaiA [Bacteroidetes bacterium]|nr:ribosome-associated translation inhibitor RaiA [Bacteroidota bacterium]
MQTTIQSLQFEADERLKTYVQEKATKLDQFFDHIIAKEITLKKSNSDADQYSVDILVRVPNQTLVASETAQNFEAATDLCVDNMARQIKRFKEKIRSRV